MAFGDLRVVYLGGMGRSGSTLAERLLGELPGVCAAGELVHLWQRGVADGERCGCGAPLRQCVFWSAVADSAFGGWSSVDVGLIAGLRARIDRTRFIPMLACGALTEQTQRRIDEYTDYYLRLYRAIADTSGCRTVVDSSKHASLAFCLSRRAEIDLRVIHVVRDSRAVAYSWTMRVRRPEAAGQSYMTCYSPARAALLWNIQNGALQLLARRQRPVLRVRYEDLVSAVSPTLRAMAGFSGLTVSESGLAFLGGGEQSGAFAVVRRSHTAAGNPMRFTAGRIDIRPDDRWQSGMPASQRRVVTALTLPLLSHYGYLRGGAAEVTA